jgi:hypothetical protein
VVQGSGRSSPSGGVEAGRGRLHSPDSVHSTDARELENAIEFAIGKTKVKVLSLERIIASKKATNREKDRLVLPVLEDAAATLRERRRRK